MSGVIEVGGAPLSGIDDVAMACRMGDPQKLFAAVDRYAQAVLRQALCTVNRFDAHNERVLRLYSSNPAAYPVGGSKNKSGTAWGRHVLHERHIYVGEGVEAIRESFDDSEAIFSLGLQSVINVPVVVRDTCLGTVNFLMTAEIVDAPKVQFAQLAALLAAPGFMVLADCART
jgi:hypothetical protein